jgi:hypothetical protein
MNFIKNKPMFLPEQSNGNYLCSQYLENRGNRYILYFDNFNDNLYVVDYDTNITQCVKINIPHKNMFKNFYAISLDSILVMEYNAISIIYLTNTKGELINKFFLGENRGSWVSSEQEPMWYDNKLILSGYTLDDKSKIPGSFPICYVYDTQTNQYTPDKVIDYPGFYYRYNWGWGNYREVFSHVQNNTILYSFPASHNVYRYDLKNKKVTEFCAGSSLIKEIHPFADNKADYEPSAKIDYTKYFWENPSYFKMIYDPYRNMYYRIVGLPYEKYDVKDIKTYRKKISIVIFDENLKFLGETLLDEKIETGMAFINQEGLHLVSKFEYKIFKPEKNE